MMTLLAPMISKRRKVRSPIFAIPLSRCLLPVECCRGSADRNTIRPRDGPHAQPGGKIERLAKGLGWRGEGCNQTLQLGDGMGRMAAFRILDNCNPSRGIGCSLRHDLPELGQDAREEH